MSKPLEGTALVWSGRLEDHHRTWKEVDPLLSAGREDIQVRGSAVSPYRTRFLQGAFLAPRILFFVEAAPAGPLGAGAGRVPVVSHRSGQEREPWKGIGTRHGSVEAEFVLPAMQGEHVMPFRVRQHPSVVVPWHGGHLIAHDDPELDRFPGLAEWWRVSSDLWLEKRQETSTGSLEARADYKSALSDQFPIAPQRVVYAASGARLTATRVIDRRIVIEKSAYWIAVGNTQEAYYLLGLFNSSVLDEAVKPYQVVGIGGARHFDKNVFEVPIPQFDPQDPDHISLAAAATAAETRVASLALPSSAIGARRAARTALDAAGLAADLNDNSARVLGL